MDTEISDNLTCPHCGHIDRDAWEINFGPGLDGEADICCRSCGKDFKAWRHCSFYYSIEKLPS